MKVLAGLLHTAPGEAAVARAVEEAKARDGEVHLVSYIRMPTGSDVGGYADERKRQEAALDQATASLEEQGVSCVGHVIDRVDTPSEAILQVARAEDVDLIVIGMRRRSRVGKLVVGSNAQDILLAADCPVLAVKARDPDSG